MSKKYTLLITGLVLIVALYFARGWLNLEAILSYKTEIIAFTQKYYLLSLLIFISVYAIAVALSFPGALILSLMGGFLFGGITGAIAIIIGATIGATALFLVAKRFSHLFLDKVSGKLEAFREGFGKNAFNYLLFLRLTPIFPFWLVNLASAFMPIKTSQFFLATLIGITPATLVYAHLGAGAGDILTSEGFKLPPSLLLGLTGLGILALVPIFLKGRK